MVIKEFFSSNDKEHWISEMKRCDWGAGRWLGELLEEQKLAETVGNGALVPMLTEGDRLVSFCTLAPLDEIQPTELTPWIGFVYTFPEYRGHRYAGMLLEWCESVARVTGKDNVYISTDHCGLYEKYGYEFLNMQTCIGGESSRVYHKCVSSRSGQIKPQPEKKIREIDVNTITDKLSAMCIEANLQLSPDMCESLEAASKSETSTLGGKILGQLKENMAIASEEQIPICQDTGMAVVFVEVGQDVHFTGGAFTEAVNEGVRRGYRDGYLRKSIVADPVNRVNTGDNTPAVIHMSMVPGDKVRLTIAPKGFGSENMSRVFMLKPADGEEGIIDSVVRAVKEAGANACPPMVVGVGVGGDFEKSAILAKKALTDRLNSVTCFEGPGESAEVLAERTERWERVRKTIFDKVNSLNIGPGGLGGLNTVLGVNIETFPTHIAGMPLAVNICCHVNRHVTREL